MNVGQREKETQQRVIKLFVQGLGYTYLGNYTERDNSNIEEGLLIRYLNRKGYSDSVIRLALKGLKDTAGSQSLNIYDLNRQT